MIVRKCDYCGREVTRCVTVKFDIWANDDRINVGDIFYFSGIRKDFCPDCAVRIITLMTPEEVPLH